MNVIRLLVVLFPAAVFALSARADDGPLTKDEKSVDSVRADSLKNLSAEELSAREEAFKRILGPIVDGISKRGSGPVENPANEVLVQQFKQQLRPFLTFELEYIRQVCDVPEEMRPLIKVAGELLLKDAAIRLALQQTDRQKRIVNAQQIMPRSIIRQGLIDALSRAIPEKELNRYRDEVNRRVAHRKHAAIMDVVGRIDSLLFLSPSQREQITNSISDNWQENWEQWVQFYMYNNQYYPSGADPHVVKHLTADQRLTWNTVQKIDFGFWEAANGIGVPDDQWWGVDLSADELNAILKIQLLP